MWKNTISLLASISHYLWDLQVVSFLKKIYYVDIAFEIQIIHNFEFSSKTSLTAIIIKFEIHISISECYSHSSVMSAS